jgi:ribosomal protein L40E
MDGYSRILEGKLMSNTLCTSDLVYPVDYKDGQPFRVDYLLNISEDVETRSYYPLRGSSIPYVCPREAVLGYWLGTEWKEKVYLPLKVTFGIGHALHSWAREKSGFMGARFLSWWVCRKCGARLLFGAHPKKCSKCGDHRYITVKEHEVSLMTNGALVCRSHPDGFFSVDLRNCILEIKSISGKLFEKLSTPVPEEVDQACWYAMSCKKDKTLPIKVDQNLVFLFYVCKEYKAMPIKFFAVPLTDHRKHRLRTKVRQIVGGIHGSSPVIPAVLSGCLNRQFLSGRPKQCRLVKQCQTLYTLSPQASVEQLVDLRDSGRI